jgi:hypothetical protein
MILHAEWDNDDVSGTAEALGKAAEKADEKQKLERSA